MAMSITVDDVIAMGDALKALKDTKGTAQPTDREPQGLPLFASVKDVVKLFGISDVNTRELIRRNADFPYVKIGSKILIDTYGLRDWLRARRGENVLE